MKKIVFFIIFLSLFTIINLTESASANPQFKESSQKTEQPIPEPEKNSNKNSAPSAIIPSTPPREEPTQQGHPKS